MVIDLDYDERRILELRRKGLSFAKIGEELDKKGPTVYRKYVSIKNRTRLLNDLSEDDPYIVKACEYYNQGSKTLFKLWAVLERNDIDGSYWNYRYLKLQEFWGIGELYAMILLKATQLRREANKKSKNDA